MEIEIKNKTERRYFFELKKFIDSEIEIENYLKTLDKHQISKLKNGFKLMDFSEKKEYLNLCDKYNKFRPKYRKKAEKQLTVKNLENTINRLKSKRLKLAYRLQEISGLRISEIAELKEENIFFNEKLNRLIVCVENGKGGKKRKVLCFEDEYVLNELLNLKIKKDGRFFNTSKYMIEQANNHNFHTHDLRKIFAHNFYFNCDENEETTIKLLKSQLGHDDSKRNKTYLKYINRDINLNNTRWDSMESFGKEDYKDY